MKKLFSAVLALTMVASTFVTTAFAAGTNFAIKANKATYDEGATVTVTVTITGETFNGFATNLTYDPEVFAFDKVDKASSSTLSAKPVGGNDAEAGIAYATYGVASNEETEIEVEDEDTGDVEMKPAAWTYYYRFKVNSNVKAGDYTFTLAEEGVGNMNSEDGPLSVSFGAPVTVHVNGTKADEVAAATAEIVGYKDAVREGYETCGVMGNVNTADSKYVQIDFADSEKLLVIDFGTVIDNVPVTFGLNIMSVPAGTKLSIKDNGVTAINELPTDETTFVKVAAE